MLGCRNDEKAVALVGILLSALIGGALDTVFEGATENVKLWVELGPMLTTLAFIFMWLHYDEREVHYHRSALLNIGVVALAFLFVPIYLYRSRPAGARGRMLLGFLCVFLLWAALSAVGFFGMRALQPNHVMQTDALSARHHALSHAADRER